MDKEGNGHEPKIPAGGWGSLKEVSTILLEEKVPPQRAALPI